MTRKTENKQKTLKQKYKTKDRKQKINKRH